MTGMDVTWFPFGEMRHCLSLEVRCPEPARVHKVEGPRKEGKAAEAADITLQVDPTDSAALVSDVSEGPHQMLRTPRP